MRPWYQRKQIEGIYTHHATSGDAHHDRCDEVQQAVHIQRGKEGAWFDARRCENGAVVFPVMVKKEPKENEFERNLVKIESGSYQAGMNGRTW
jgi:hypothetical protein